VYVGNAATDVFKRNVYTDVSAGTASKAVGGGISSNDVYVRKASI
jgi:hypothetical protein